MYRLRCMHQIMRGFPGKIIMIKNIKEYLKDHKMATKIIATLIGAGLGFAYYKFIGCRSGACPITSNPYISTAWGALMGFLIAG